MTRNGSNFGIKISGMGDQWFTAPVNTPQGLFFLWFQPSRYNPDISDSVLLLKLVLVVQQWLQPGSNPLVGASVVWMQHEVTEDTQYHRCS